MNIKLAVSGVFITLLFFSCQGGQNKAEENPDELAAVPEPLEVVGTDSIQIPIYDFNGFEPFLSLKDDKVHVVNFWATWCVPCVAELPYFEKLNVENPNVEVLLVSLDFKKLINDKLIPFILENKIQSKVILLDDPDGNAWIPKVDENWSGAIPATVIYTKDKKVFYEGTFTEESLAKEVQKFEK